MGFPCKEKSHIITLFANLHHLRMHQVLHTLNRCDVFQFVVEDGESITVDSNDRMGFYTQDQVVYIPYDYNNAARYV